MVCSVLDVQGEREMTRFLESFRGHTPAFVIAIHVGLDETAWKTDFAIARGEGADGIILIRDYTTPATDEHVLQAYDYARSRFPGWWIGINLLQHTSEEAVMA